MDNEDDDFDEDADGVAAVFFLKSFYSNLNVCTDSRTSNMHKSACIKFLTIK